MSDSEPFYLVQDGPMGGDTSCSYEVRPRDGVTLSKFITGCKGQDTLSFTLNGERCHLRIGEMPKHPEWAGLIVTGGTAYGNPYGGGADFSLTVRKPLPSIDKSGITDGLAKLVDAVVGKSVAAAWREGFKAGVRTVAASIDPDRLADSAVNPYERSR